MVNFLAVLFYSLQHCLHKEWPVAVVCTVGLFLYCIFRAGSVSDTEIRQLHWPGGRQPQVSDEHVLRCSVAYLSKFQTCIYFFVMEVDDV